jgi:hypothetical protein
MNGLPISRETATVFRGGGRRFFTLNAALRAEAKKIIRLACDGMGENYREIDVVCFHNEVTRLVSLMKAGVVVTEETIDFDNMNKSRAT